MSGQDGSAPSAPTNRVLDNEGTLYAPTLLSWEAGLFVEDACPMRYDVEDTRVPHPNSDVG